MSRKLGLAVSLTMGVALAGGGATMAVAAPSATAAAGTCTLARTVCLWDQTSFDGNRFTTQSLNPSTGTCVNLAAHGWGNGRPKSGRNTGNQVARLYSSTDCTGLAYQLIPQGAYGSIDYDSNSIYVY